MTTGCGDTPTYLDYSLKTTTVKTSTGGSSTSYRTSRLLAHRDVKSCAGSPQRLLTPSGPTWRDPSTYERSVIEMEHYTGTSVLDQKDGYVTTSELIMDDGIDNYSFNPQSSNGGRVIWSNELESEAVVKATQRMKDLKAGLGEDLGQAVQTYRMLADTGMTLLKALLAFKNGRVRDLPLAFGGKGNVRYKAGRGVNLFLEYKYGWKPLCQDIYGLVQLFKEQMKPALLVHASARSHSSAITAVSNLWNGVPVERSGGGTHSAMVHLWAQLDSNVHHIADQLGLANPLSLGWDLIPYSFVVDWFSPVGGVLDTLLPPQGMTFVGGTCSQKMSLNVTSKGQYTKRDTVFLKQPVTVFRSNSLLRRTYNSWPKAGFYATNPFSSSHGQSAFALILQRLRL